MFKLSAVRFASTQASAKWLRLRLPQLPLLLLMLLLLSGTHPPCHAEGFAEDEPASSEEVDFSVTDLSTDIDGFRVDPSLEDVISDALLSREERHREASTTRHPFEKSCPYGYFTCANGECIAKRWRCDGHYDCDDFTDELNCTTLDIPQHGSILPAGSTYVAPPPPPPSSSSSLSSSSSSPSSSPSRQNTSGGSGLPSSSSSSSVVAAAAAQAAAAAAAAAAVAAQSQAQAPKRHGVEFNSSIEPLMIFSTGSSIRGFWMRSRIYFDVITRNKPHSPASAQTSITDAFSLFFGILGGGGGGGAGAGSSSPVGAKPASGADAAAGAGRPVASKPETTIVGLDMDASNKEVYWVELGREPGVYSAMIEDDQFESRHKRAHHGPRKVVEFGLLSPEDISLDPIGRNLYITDAGLPAIIVCAYVHVHCKIIVNYGIHKPRAIIADPATGWVTFSDWGDHPGIYLVSMDGRRRETLIDTDIIWPNGLAADSSSNSLYWADARLQKIERIDLATRKRDIVIREPSTNPFSVSLFEARIYWSDWSQNEIKTCNKLSGGANNNNANSTTQVLMHAEDIYGIHIYHPDLHKRERSLDNPCWSRHCSHLCLLSPSSPNYATRALAPTRAVCACPDHMSLSIFDKATCMEIETPMVLMNVRNYIAAVWPDRIGLRNIEEIVHSQLHAIQDVASDWHRNYRLYFFDAARQSIYEADFSGRRPTLANLTRVGPGAHLRGLTYDWMSDNLYWLDHQAGTLTMYSIRGDFQRVLKQRLARPTSMVLDSRNRLLYIACMDNAQAHILRTDMTGAESSDLIVVGGSSANGPLGLPVALHLDEQLQRLYWADARAQTIESVELDVKSRTTGTRAPSARTVHRRSLGLIVSFTVFQDSFVWTASNDPYLYRARVAPAGAKASKPLAFRMPPNPLAKTFPEIDYRRLITVNMAAEGSTSACLTTTCSHGCILDSTHDPKCVCPDGMKLSLNNRTNCIDASKHEDCLTCLPAVAEAMAAHAKAAAAAGSGGGVPAISSGAGASLSNIIRHLDGTSQAPAPAQTNAAAGTQPSALIPAHAQPLGPPEHKKLDQDKHEDWIFEHSLPAANHNGHQHEHEHQHGEAGQVSAVSVAADANGDAGAGNKMVWLIVFILILSSAGLITMLSLLMLHKQGRLPNPVTVSFIAPDRDKDRAMLLLDTDAE